MINNVNQFKKAIKNGRVKGIKRIYNFDKKAIIPEGMEAEIVHIQSNAIRIKYENGKESWTYFQDLTIKENKIIYFQYIDSHNEDKVNILRNMDINVEKVAMEDKINSDYCKTTNILYTYKFVTTINEIIEV